MNFLCILYRTSIGWSTLSKFGHTHSVSDYIWVRVKGQSDLGLIYETTWILERAKAQCTQRDLITVSRMWGLPTHFRKTCFLLVEFPKKIVLVNRPTHLVFFCNWSGMQVIILLPLTCNTHTSLACPYWNWRSFLCGHALGDFHVL